MTAIVNAIFLAALSQIESGDNDQAIGKAGEVSRWQCRAQFYAGKHPSDPDEARPLVFKLLESRCEKFAAANHRNPTPVEIELLWNRPAHVLHPSNRELERARRFENLVNAFSSDPCQMPASRTISGSHRPACIPTSLPAGSASPRPAVR